MTLKTSQGAEVEVGKHIITITSYSAVPELKNVVSFPILDTFDMYEAIGLALKHLHRCSHCRGQIK